jgi:hypothetical protein
MYRERSASYLGGTRLESHLGHGYPNTGTDRQSPASYAARPGFVPRPRYRNRLQKIVLKPRPSSASNLVTSPCVYVLSHCILPSDAAV